MNPPLQDSPDRGPRQIGEMTDYGEIVGIKFIDGERYYFCQSNGRLGTPTISFMPSNVIEATEVSDSQEGK